MIEPNSRVRVVKDIYSNRSPYVGKEGYATLRAVNGWWVTVDDLKIPRYFHDTELEEVSTKARRVVEGLVEQFDGPLGDAMVDGENLSEIVLGYIGKRIRVTVEEV